MRIISPFRDYYDGVSPGDVEPVWVRRTRSQPLAPPHAEHDAALVRALEQLPLTGLWLEHYSPLAVAFCGQVYLGYTDNRDVIWSRPPLERELRRVWSCYEGKRVLTAALQDGDRAFLSDAERAMAARSEVPIASHRAWDSPAVVLRRASGGLERITNPCLSGLGFASLVDPHTAWQELDMCLGTMGQPPPDAAPPRTQEEIRDAHGFDGRSFRQEAPGRRKARRRKKRRG